MKPILLLTCLVCLQLKAQNCMVGQEAADFLEYEYSAAHFGYNGSVKSVTRTHETLNKEGDFETIHNVWGDHYLIDRLNFNEQGNLTTMYQETKQGDTMAVIKIEYDDQHRISKVSEHEFNIWKKYEPFNGTNWPSRFLHYRYDKNTLSFIIAEGDWHLPTSIDSCRLDFQYENGKVVKKTISSLDTANTIISIREYNYNQQSGLLDELVTAVDLSGQSEGKTQFNYAPDSQTLLSRVFFPVHLGFMKSEATWNYDAQKNIINYSSGDTLKEYWFCYKGFQYNDLNDIVLEYSNSENDGRNRLVTNYSYVYDAQKNWTQKNTRVQNYIDFDWVTDRVDAYRRLQEIEYY